jgi:hypothetical protein
VIVRCGVLELQSEPIQLDRNELAGAFGDLGTFAPLVIGMIAVCKLDAVSIITVFGLWYVITGLVYRLPVPVQPMKAVAALAISGAVSFSVIRGAGMMMGMVLLGLTLTGSLNWFAKITPRSVVRGIQLGLGLTLMSTAVSFMQKQGTISLMGYGISFWIIAAICVVIVLALYSNRRLPPMLVILPLGVALSFMSVPLVKLLAFKINLPSPSISLTTSDLWMGLLTLGIAQIPLTIGNSVIATDSLARSIFPKNKTVTIKKLGFTLGVMNVFSAIAGGIPMCHGAGGLAGHYRFGARRGTCLLIFGGILIVLGIFFGNTLTAVFDLIPYPVLGVILFFASIELAMAIRDIDVRTDLFVVFVVAVSCAFVQYGYLIGWVGGIALAYALGRNWIRLSSPGKN